MPHGVATTRVQNTGSQQGFATRVHNIGFATRGFVTHVLARVRYLMHMQLQHGIANLCFERWCWISSVWISEV
jgi:hypothetical protein